MLTLTSKIAGFRIFRDGRRLSDVGRVHSASVTARNGERHRYYLKTRGRNGVLSAASTSVYATALPPRPAAPAGLVATAASGSVMLGWKSVAGAAHYRIYRDGGLRTTVGTATAWTDNGLTNGQRYTYRVASVDRYGQASAQSTAITAQPMPPYPASPTGLTAASGDQQVALAWTSMSGVNHYQVVRDGAVVASPATAAWTDANVVNGTTYHYAVQAVDRFGRVSDPSLTVAARPVPPAPGAPGPVTAAAGDGQVQLDWSAVDQAVSYDVSRDRNVVATVLAPTTTLTDTELTNGRRVSYTIVAVDRFGQRSPGSTPTVATPLPEPPAAVSSLTATPGDGQVALNWTGADRATSYRIIRDGATVGTTSSTSWTDTTPSNGVQYAYLIVAVDDFGQEAAGSPVAAATPMPSPPATPTGLSAVGADRQVTLTWTPLPNLTYSIMRDGVLRPQPSNSGSGQYVDTGLTNGVGHDYQVRAEDPYGQLSAWSAFVTAFPHTDTGSYASTPSGVTGAPTSATSAHVSWFPVANATGRYRVQRSTSQSSGWVDVATPTSTSFDDNGLIANTVYYYRVFATNSYGDSPESRTVGVNTAAPGTPTFSNVSSSAATLSWTGVANGTPGSTPYQVQRATDPNGPFTTVLLQTTNTYWQDSGLTANTVYYYRVIVTYQAVTGWTSLPSSNGQVLTLDAPMEVSGAPTSATTAHVSWSPVADATGYRVQRSTSQSSGWVDVATPTATSFDDTALAANNVYYYRVFASRSYGDSLSATVGVNTAAPGTPTFYNVTSSAVQVSWSGVANGPYGYTSYQVQRATDPNGPFTTLVTSTSNTYWQDSGLTRNTVYYYRVIASYNGWTSLPSSNGQVLTLDAPAGVSAAPVSATSAHVSWLPVADAIGYRVQRAKSPSSSWVDVATPTATSFDDTALAANNVYYYRVFATNSNGDSPGSATVGVNTAAPGTPTFSSVSSSAATVSWTAVLYGAYATYTVQRATDPNGPFTTLVTSTSNTYWQDSGLTSNTVYYYRVIASYNGWTSLPSSDGQVLTAP